MSKPVKYCDHTGPLKAFTIVEILITLVLTSIAITLSYGTLSYIQKLFQDYKVQNRFIHQYTALRQRLDYEALKGDIITEESDNRFVIRRDSIVSYLSLLDKKILLKQGGQCDTFYITAKNIQKTYEPMKNPHWVNKLVRSLHFETDYTKQRFNFYFYKNYDASVKLALDVED